MIGGSKIDVVIPVSRGPEIALAIDVAGRIPIGPCEDVRELLHHVVRERVELSQVVTIEEVECALLARQHCQVWSSSWLVWQKEQSTSPQVPIVCIECAPIGGSEPVSGSQSR